MSVSSRKEPSTNDRTDRVHRAVARLLQRRTAGERVTDDRFLEEHADLLPDLATALGRLRSIDSALQDAKLELYANALSRLNAPDAQIDDLPIDNRPIDHGSETADADGGPAEETFSGRSRRRAVPERIGRYRVRRVLADGGFGRVFLASDDQLARDVAIKVPHRHRVKDSADTEAYLNEARMVAGLDHPAIVPVFDVGTTEDGFCYVVSKLIRGTDLSAKLESGLLPCNETVRIVKTVANALHHAHCQGLVHRDVKPGNILLDDDGEPFITDFGLALTGETEEQGSCAGTPAYMSPEQARGEAHRVDRRSDIFSLGIVLYEMLTGTKPFQANSYEQLLANIAWEDPQPPSQVEPSVPAELERICLKSLSKRAADRYATAREMADDLREFLKRSGLERSSDDKLLPLKRTAPAGSAAPPQAAARIVPKGLRPFDAGDADFYLELVPGPRDRDGLPESVRLWKQRIDQRDPDETCAVGLLYGPSGCGKSSLVRAGLLPRLASHVHAIYVEATADETEMRLLSRLHRKVPHLAEHDTLVDCLAAVRRGEGLEEGQKLLIVIDQLEQWLHGRRDEDRRSLVQALRQSDGGRLQCLLLVRDDFWLGLSRLMGDLEVDLVAGHNTTLVDLFDPSHAGNVLAKFGQSYGRLPERPGDRSEQQSDFLETAIRGLSEEDRIVPARLALFAEMVKSRDWTPKTLKGLGGAAGTGIAFLEETFGKRSTNPQYRAHQRAARAVLRALLPAPGSSIKGRVRSYPELLDESGYGKNPRAFKELMRILDGETRLLTPTDPEGLIAEGQNVAAGKRYYQLSHDYLVPSLRQWLTERQQASPVGRTELRLAERAVMWNARPERRQLPSLWEWATIWLLTRPSSWSAEQRKMMRVATRRHAFGLAAVTAMGLLFLITGVEMAATTRSLLMQFRARAAALLVASGGEEAVWPLLQHGDDPTLRTDVIHGISPLFTRPEDIIAQLPQQHDPSIRRALVLVAGELVGDSENRTSRWAALRQNDPLIEELLQMYSDDPEAGMHAAVEWTLQRYEQYEAISRIDTQLASTGIQGTRQWYVNQHGHTMVVIAGPAYFMMGAEDDEQPPHEQWIRRTFCMASKETTVAQFRRFAADTSGPAERLDDLFGVTDASPRASVDWYQAAAYCNWLSAQEGLSLEEWCYEPNKAGQFAEGMRLADNWTDRRGYRLPTEAEWEYACRALAKTPWHCGNNAAQLENYATFLPGSSGQPSAVGARKPNDFGLFDMHGNVAEWCQDLQLGDTAGASRLRATVGEAGIVRETTRFAIRGGSCRDRFDGVRSATRERHTPNTSNSSLGFRVARTYP